MEININNFQIATQAANKLQISNVQIIKLGEDGHAIAAWHLLGEDGKFIKSGTIELKGKEYNDWGSDDNYLLNIALSKLNLTSSK